MGPKPKTMKFFEGYSSFDELIFDIQVSTYVGSEFGNREIGAFGDGVPLSLLLIIYINNIYNTVLITYVIYNI